MKEKKTILPENFFKACCGVWAEVYGEVVPAPPGEEKADPRIFKDKIEMKHLKYILKDLRERAEEKKIEWTEMMATTRFRAFVMRAAEDDFISKNFLLRIINNNKTRIFNNQINPKKNERPKTINGFNSDNTGGVKKLGTSEARIQRAKDW